MKKLKKKKKKTMIIYGMGKNLKNNSNKVFISTNKYICPPYIFTGL